MNFQIVTQGPHTGLVIVEYEPHPDGRAMAIETSVEELIKQAAHTGKRKGLSGPQKDEG